MKRLLLILPLLCLGADTPEIEGWRIVSGEWTIKGKVLRGKPKEDVTVATILHEQEAWGDFSAEVGITVVAATKPHNLVSFQFRRATDGSRYQLCLRAPGQVTIDRYSGGTESAQNTRLYAKDIPIPTGKCVLLKLLVKNGMIQGSLGRALKFKVADSHPLPPGRIALETLNATGEFEVKNLRAE